MLGDFPARLKRLVARDGTSPSLMASGRADGVSAHLG